MMFDGLLLLTIVQVLAEVLPISSSGHVQLVQRLLLAGTGRVAPTLLPGTNDLLNGMSMLVMVTGLRVAWFSPLWLALHGTVSIASRWRLAFLVLRMTLLVASATCVTVPIYLGGAYLLERHGAPGWLLPLGFGVTAWLLWCSRQQNRIGAGQPLTWLRVLLLGLVQGLAVVPGVSRMGVVYSIAVLLGMRSDRALQTAVALCVPLMTAATVRALLSGNPIWPFSAFETFIVGGALLGSYGLFSITCRLAAVGRLGLVWRYSAGVAILAWLCWFFSL